MTDTHAVLSAHRIAELLGQHQPTPEQVLIIEQPLVPSLVVAGAGSGKTETMAARVVWLIANGFVAPEQVLGLTFTRKAAGELGERVRQRLRHLARAGHAAGTPLPEALRTLDLARPTVSTYHAYAASLVADHALRLGLEPTSRLLGEAAQWQLAADVVESWGDDLATEAATSTVVDAVLTMSGALDEHLLSPDVARRGMEDIVEAIQATPGKIKIYAQVRELVELLGQRVRLLDVVAEYRRRKRIAESLDFGDQVAIAARLAREVPAVGASERARFPVVLLDEFQDTSFAQLALLTALFGEGHAVTAVGDPHQSIYGWRGASPGGLERFPHAFPEVLADGRRRNAVVHPLSTSWRNDHAVLSAANELATPLRRLARGGVALPELVARPGAGEGAVVAQYLGTVEEEATAIAQHLATRWRPAAPGTPRVTAAVLCRKRSQFGAIRQALRAAGLPVEVVGLGGLLTTPEVVDLVATLQAVHDPTRGDALVRLLTGARVRLGAADLHALAAWADELASRHGPGRRGPVRPGTAIEAGSDGGENPAVVEGDTVDARSIVDALDDLPRPGWRSRTGRALSDVGHARLTELAELLRTLRSHAYLSLPELVGEAERLLGLDIEVAARPGVSPGRARAQLDAFRDVAVQFADAADAATLGAFLAWLEAAEKEERGLERPLAEPDPDAIQIITVHAAKGLEWDVVAVAGLVDGVFPAQTVSGAKGPTDSAWLKGLGTLPYPLRGDRADLPDFAYAGAADHKELEQRRQRFLEDAGQHELAEERRLAYVAVTRARRDLLLTGFRWGEGKNPRTPSLFLTELVEAGLVTTQEWAPEPEPGTTNPRTDEITEHVWPADPFGPAPTDPVAPLHRRVLVEAAADAVRRALAATDDTDGWRASAEARIAEVLLAERSRSRRPDVDVELPAHLSASAVVRLAADPDAFARALRRPVPLEPSPQARRGTAFHAWVEGYFGAAALVDVDELPGADDDSLAVDADQAALRAAFLATPWAHRRPVAVEVDVETPVAGYVLRSRIDAVFPDPDRPEQRDAVVVVDWKTGRPPTDPAAVRTRELQLAVYRLAWSRRTGTPLDRVRAAFVYVGAGVTAEPERLLDGDEIEELLLAAAPGALSPAQPVR